MNRDYDYDYHTVLLTDHEHHFITYLYHCHYEYRPLQISLKLVFSYITRVYYNAEWLGIFS